MASTPRFTGISTVLYAAPCNSAVAVRPSLIKLSADFIEDADDVSSMSAADVKAEAIEAMLAHFLKHHSALP